MLSQWQRRIPNSNYKRCRSPSSPEKAISSESKSLGERERAPHQSAQLRVLSVRTYKRTVHIPHIVCIHDPVQHLNVFESPYSISMIL